MTDAIVSRVMSSGKEERLDVCGTVRGCVEGDELDGAVWVRRVVYSWAE